MNNSTNYENVIKQAGTKKKSILFNFRKTYPAYLILILFVGASFGVRYLVEESVMQSSRKEFDKAASSVLSRLNNQLERHEQVLSSMHGLYGENIEVVRDYFELYGAVPAKTYSSILSLSYVPQVEGKDWDNFYFSARSQGYFDYQLQPEGKRPLYYPILHCVLLERNNHRIGFDYATVPEIKTAIEASRDKDQTIATNALNLRPDTLGFCLISAIYQQEMPKTNLTERQENFQATLVLEISYDEFFNTGLRGNDGQFFPSDSTIIFEFFEKNGTQEHSLFRSKNYSLIENQYLPLFVETIEFNVADKVWNAKFQTVPNFGGQFQAYLPTLAFIGSLLTSFLFFAFIVSVITSRSRAEDLAERMTRSQRRILEATKDIIGVVDFNANWKSVNPAVMAVLGYSSDEFLTKKFDEFFANPKDYDELLNTIKSSANEQTHKFDFQFIRKDSELVWLNFSLTVSNIDNLVYAIGRDVTLEKLAEQEARIKRKQIELAEQFALEASHSKSFFMIKLSHQLRNSLTSIIGYLQLLSGKIYDTDEEMESYIRYAEEGSEEIFTFVSDIVDATIEHGESSIEAFVNTKIKPAMNNALAEFKQSTGKSKVSINIDDSGTEPTALVNPTSLKKALVFSFKALVSDIEDASLDATIMENHYEGATEIQILGQGNSEIAELIKLYKDNSTNIIESLKFDKNDVISNIAKAASYIRRMNGTISVETFGGEEGNIIMITLQLVKRNM